jgi:hypothetical protein
LLQRKFYLYFCKQRFSSPHPNLYHIIWAVIFDVDRGRVESQYAFFRSFDFYLFSLCFFRVKRLDEMLQILTHHRLEADDGLLLVAHPPHLRSSSTTLSSSSNSLPMIKFKVCGECGTYFGRGRFVTFLKLKLTSKI